MRIVSDFRDYYDVVQAAGQDQTLVYVRKPRKASYDDRKNPYPFPFFRHSGFRRARGDDWGIGQYVIGFCGKIYPVLAVGENRPGDASSADMLETLGPHGGSPCYNIEEVDAVLKRTLSRRASEQYRWEKRWKWPWYGRDYPYEFRREALAKYFKECAAKRDAFEQLFVDNKSPLFVATITWTGWHLPSQACIIFNACLRNFEFYRVVDTYTAFQEVQMCYGGLAQPNRPIPTVSDKDMVTAKGFDKWSFRKRPKEK